MRTDEYEFPVTPTPLDTYLEHCISARPAYKFLSKHFDESDELSSIVRFMDEDEQKRFAWCWIQRIHDVYLLRVTYFEAETERALGAAERIFQTPSEAILDRTLDVLDDMRDVPVQARSDYVLFIKSLCEEQFFEVTIAELTCVDIDEYRETRHLLHELVGYCNAIGY